MTQRSVVGWCLIPSVAVFVTIGSACCVGVPVRAQEPTSPVPTKPDSAPALPPSEASPNPAPPTTDRNSDATLTTQSAPEAAFARGVAAYKAGDSPNALREMRQAVRDNNKDAAAHRWLGFLLVRNRQPQEGVAPLTRAVALLNDARKTIASDARSGSVAGRELALLRADLSDAHTHLGDALLALPNPTVSDTRRAVDSFRRAAQYAPTTASAFYNLGFAHTRAAQYVEAARAYRKSLALAPKDEKAWRTWSGLGFALQKQGIERYAEAAEAYREGANRNKEEPSLWLSLGSLQMERGPAVRASAISALETARKLDAQNYAATVTLARAYAEAERFDEAAMLFAAAAALPEAKPSQTQATLLYNRGVVLARANKLDDAQTAYEQALGLKPRYYDALVNLGFVLYSQNKTDDAVARFRQATSVLPNSFLAWSNLGAALIQKKDVPAATIAWRKAAQIEPQNYDARVVLSDLFVQQERTDEAIAVYRQMAALRPESALPMNALGLAYQKKGDTGGAFGAFREAVRREPRNAAAHNNLGVLHEKRNNLVAAIAEYKTALLLNPNFDDAKANLRRFGAQAISVKPAPIDPSRAPKSRNAP